MVSSVDSTLYLVDDSAKEKEHVNSNNTVQKALVTSHDFELSNDINTLHKQLHEACLKIEGLRNELSNRNVALDNLCTELAATTLKVEVVDELHKEVEVLKKSLKQQTIKAKQFWTQKCEQLLAHEAIIEEKDAKIAALKELARVVPSVSADIAPDPPSEVSETSLLSEVSTVIHGRRGKAPPVDAFNGNDPELWFEDWLPTLERKAK